MTDLPPRNPPRARRKREGSTLEMVVLGLLLQRPGDPDDLYERLDREFGDLVPATRSEVHEALKRLEQVGWVEKH
jgi:DNA-binding PadR family transcriptional regulator